MIKLSQAGDTIVEVLVAIAVVSLVLGSAFLASNRSQKSTQQAQEHAAALKVAEGQVELLKAASDKNGASSPIYTTTHLFCMDSSSGGVVSDNIKSGINPVNMGTLVTTNALNSTGDNNLTYGTCKQSGSFDYHIAIDRALVTAPTPANPYGQYLFTVHIRWDSVQNAGHDEVTLTYKVDVQ